MEQKSGLEFSGDGTAGYMHGTAGYMVEKVKIVSVHVRYFSFFQFLQFMSVRLPWITSGYVRLRQFMLEGRDRTWSSTISFLHDTDTRE